MHISHVVIRNFKVLADIECDLSPSINVIVGPNAVGKTTVLQAIRAAKALAAPRTQNEAWQTLISLGAASPHFPQRLFLRDLAGDRERLVEVRCTYVPTKDELDAVRASLPEFVRAIVASRLGQAFSNPVVLTQYLQSPAGQQTTMSVTKEVGDALQKIERDGLMVIGVTANVTTGEITHSDPLAGSVFAFLDQRQPPSSSIFSYFPADRALPFGDVPMQIGAPDLAQQLEIT